MSDLSGDVSRRREGEGASVRSFVPREVCGVVDCGRAWDLSAVSTGRV